MPPDISPSSIVTKATDISTDVSKAVNTLPSDSSTAAFSYPLLFAGNSAAEYLKTGRQAGFHSSYKAGMQDIIIKHGAPLQAPAKQMFSRLTCRSTATVAALYNFPITPTSLATLDTLILTPFENYRMLAVTSQQLPSFGEWLKQTPSSGIYRGVGTVLTRQWSQWEGSYAIRDYLKDNTCLNHDQATLVGIIAGTLLSMPADMARNIIQDPRNANLSYKEIGKALTDATKNGTLFRGGIPRTLATICNFALSVKVMEQAENSWRNHVIKGRRINEYNAISSKH